MLRVRVPSTIRVSPEAIDAQARQIARETGETPNHANWLENFPFTRVAEVPSGAKPAATWTGDNPTRAELGDGSFGGAYQVADATMHRLFEAVVREAADLLRAL